MQPTEKQIRDALKKDFDELYVKEFTATWEIARMVRKLEIDVMPLRNIMKLFREDRIREIGVMIDNYADMDD